MTSTRTLEATAGAAAGVFSNGGLTDLVVANPGSNTLSVLSSLGGGRFTNPRTILTAHPARMVRVADLNGDHRDDLVVLDEVGLIEIFLNQGGGLFAAQSRSSRGPSRRD